MGENMRKPTSKLIAILLAFTLVSVNIESLHYSFAQDTSQSSEIVEGLEADYIDISTVRLEWNEVDDASGYEIYRSDFSEDKYVLLDTVSKDTNKYTNSSLTSATSYYYKVRFYKETNGNKYYGEYSDVLKATTKPLTPSVSAQQASTTSAKLTWTNISEIIDGYEIYMSTSKDDEYKSVGTTSNKSFTVSSLSQDKTYYFKVRAYRVVDDNKVYGDFSTPQSSYSKTTVNGLMTTCSKTAGQALTNKIKISPAYGRKVYLQMLNSSTKAWETKATYTTSAKNEAEINLVYPSEWYAKVSSSWRVYIPSVLGASSYTSPTITVTAKRVYNNPSGYIQLKEKITVEAGGANLVKGTMGLRVAQVQRKLGMGHCWEIVGSNTMSKVKGFQRRNRLPATGIVDIKTWKKLGFSEASWYSLDTYVTPVKTNLTSTKEDHIETMINTAMGYLGTEYIVGAAGKPGTGIDCSGLVMQSMYSVGIDPSPISVVRHTKPGYEYESRNLFKLK
jgi:cell wall-associated NlpC family hydrolase